MYYNRIEVTFQLQLILMKYTSLVRGFIIDK